MADHANVDLNNEYIKLKGVEEHKNLLIEELLRRHDKLSEEYEREKLDHARETQFNRDGQLREQRLQAELRSCKDLIDRDAFILVLIDGDGMIFSDTLIKQGEIGGKDAAARLYDAVRDYVRHEIPNMPSDYKIVTRNYANLKGLGEVCHRASILDKPSTIEDFARGFTGSKHLFDFVDVGMGKDRADDKISETFKLHLNNCHCRHIIFGCSHDNGYARLLEDVADRRNLDRITLMEGVPFERELAALQAKYRSIKFQGLFRTTKINVYQQQYIQPFPSAGTSSAPYQSPYQPTQSPYQAQQSMHYHNGPTNQPTYPPPQPTQSALQRHPSTTTTNVTAKMNPMATSWASAAIAAPAQPASPPPTPQRSPAVPTINRNKYNQRIDPLFPYDKEANKKLRALHLCNVHFLRHDCPYGDSCTHDHSYKPSKNELATLRGLARQTPCKFGSACDDPICIYGHRCPVSKDGEKSCYFQNNCWFPEELHGLDTKIVQTTKIGK